MMGKLLILFNVIIVPFDALAYLDPATGSLLGYFAFGLFSALLFFLRKLFYKSRASLMGIKNDSAYSLGASDILFYSEGGSYWNVFLPVIEELSARKVSSVYFTSDKSDPGLKCQLPYLNCKYIGEGFSAYTILNNLEVSVMVLTTPQLDIMHLKRSKNVKHYCHLIHAPTDVLIYKKFAFDYFDSVMCSGKHQIESLRQLEKLRKLPEKDLLQTGLTYYDVLLRSKNKYIKDGNTIEVLIAPTWGTNSLLAKFGSNPIEILLKAGFSVTLRPHPQTYISQVLLIRGIENSISGYKNLVVDNSPSAQRALDRADILLSDVSGIIFDFFFLYNKPILVFEGEIDCSGLEAEDLDKEIWETTIFPKIARSISKKDIDDLPDIVEMVVSETVEIRNDSIRDESIYNFGFAGKVAADQILMMVDR